MGKMKRQMGHANLLQYSCVPTCSEDVLLCTEKHGILTSACGGFSSVFLMNDHTVSAWLPESGGKPTVTCSGPSLMTNSICWAFFFPRRQNLHLLNFSSALEQLRTNPPSLLIRQFFKCFKPILTSPKSLCFSRLVFPIPSVSTVIP